MANQLTDEQSTQYFAEEGQKANPLTPLNWLKNQTDSDTVINSEVLGGDQSLVTVPEKGTTPESAGVMAGINAENESLAKSLEIKDKGLSDLAKTYAGIDAEPPSLADKYTEVFGRVPTGDELDTYTAEFNESKAVLDKLQAELAGITAESQQAKIQLREESVGKNVTARLLGKRQAEVDRRAAIKALPIQAQIFAAQAVVNNNKALLDSAKGKVDQYFGLVQQDIQNTYNYNKDLRDKIFSYAEKDEQRQFQADQKADDRTYQESQQVLSDAKSLATTALENGQSDLFRQLMNPDITAEEVASLGSQIREKTSGDGNTVETIPFDQFVDEYMQTDAGQKILNSLPLVYSEKGRREEFAKIVRDLYDQTSGETPKVKFTNAQKLKLEQAELLNAPRQKQLDHLYGKKDSDNSDSSGMSEEEFLNFLRTGDLSGIK